MELVWGRFQAAYPRKTSVMDDDAAKIRQPLMTSDIDDSEDEEMGGLLPRRSTEEGAAARRKRRRRKDEEDLGEVARGFNVSVEPLQLLRTMSKWMTSPGNLLIPPKSSLPAVQKLTHHRKAENMDEVSDRALTLLAVITIGFCVLLLLVVYTQA